MIRLPSSEVYTSIFIITEENTKFKFNKDTFGKFSFEELKDDPEEILSISDITSYHLQHGKIGPRIIEAYGKWRSEKSRTDGVIIL